jgi:BirA family biotin operon repressor/biotin-[acetyl-CoA-carboxylase] ligase
MHLNWFKNYNLLTFESLDSTNSEALRLASSGASGDFIILSREQTGGRGQRGSEWVSISTNLHASILLDSNSDPKRHPQLSFVIANAMYEAIAAFAAKYKLALDIKLKWPNDVLIGGKKVAGILLESINFKDKNYVVVGFGVNVMETPTKLGRPVTSLFAEGIKLQHSDEFLFMLINKFDKLYTQWKLENNFVKTRKNWLKRAYNLNKVITVDDGVRRISGIFKEIDLYGALRLQLASGQFYNLVAGEVLIDREAE